MDKVQYVYVFAVNRDEKSLHLTLPFPSFK